MVINNKRALAVFIALLFTGTMLVLSLQDPAWAEENEGSTAGNLTDKKIEMLMESAPPDGELKVQESAGDAEAGDESDGEGTGVHADPATFEKNFLLSPAQKEWTIRECEKVVDEILDDNMSDLEKYYTLAVWVNQHVEYDWEFWNGRYHFEYYSHQWDAYGAMKGKGVEKSVCVGIAIFYSNMCHAAGLPCKFVRTIPTNLDHTINYIPDINGNAYYVDVTENMFLMSEKSNPFQPVDKEFSKITKDATNYSLDYILKDEYTPSPLKDDNGNYKTYDQWFTEFALHKNTKKKFVEAYVENGSGLKADDPKYYHASYHEFPSNFSEKPDIWYLEDFYTAPTTKESGDPAKDYSDPSIIKNKILNKEFDEQLLNVSGLKENYDCSVEELAGQVGKDISVSYFPSVKDGEIVPEAADLTEGTDYTVTASAGDTANTAKITIEAAGSDYKGQCEYQVKINSALVIKAPAPKKELAYDGTLKELIEPGEAENGVMKYAIGDKTEVPKDEAFSDQIPSEANAGEYYIWYKVEGDENHAGVEPERMALSVAIAPMEVGVLVKNMTVKVGETAVISPKLDKNFPAKFIFINITPKLISVTEDGVVKGLREGRAMVFVDAELKYGSSNYKPSDYNIANINVVKTANPIKLKAKTVKIKAKALKKKAQTIKQAKAFTVKKAKGTLSYKLVSAKKGNKSFKSKFSVNKKTGKLTVKKGLKKGTYKVTVKVKAKGDQIYKASPWKKVTFKVRVK